jgi:hypothetical protein
MAGYGEVHRQRVSVQQIVKLPEERDAFLLVPQQLGDGSTHPPLFSYRAYVFKDTRAIEVVGSREGRLAAFGFPDYPSGFISSLVVWFANGLGIRVLFGSTDRVRASRECPTHGKVR